MAFLYLLINGSRWPERLIVGMGKNVHNIHKGYVIGLSYHVRPPEKTQKKSAAATLLIRSLEVAVDVAAVSTARQD